MVEDEKIRRVVMSSQPPENPEAKVFVAQNPNPDLKAEVRGDSIVKCNYCRKEGYQREGCWFLYPHLRPKGSR
jgi:hypothetical protein